MKKHHLFNQMQRFIDIYSMPIVAGESVDVSLLGGSPLQRLRRSSVEAAGLSTAGYRTSGYNARTLGE